MEPQPQSQQQSVTLHQALSELPVYQFLTWQLPLKTQLLYTFLLQFLFYLYIFRGIPLITLFSCYFLYKLLVSLIFRKSTTQNSESNDSNKLIPEGEEWLSEEKAKKVYVVVYIAANKAVQEIRNIVHVKGGIKAFGKVAMFMYISLLVKFLTDKWVIYLLITGAMVYPQIKKRLPKKAEGQQSGEGGKIRQLFRKLWLKIPKYSDLQQQQQRKRE